MRYQTRYIEARHMILPWMLWAFFCQQQIHGTPGLIIFWPLLKMFATVRGEARYQIRDNGPLENETAKCNESLPVNMEPAHVLFQFWVPHI